MKKIIFGIGFGAIAGIIDVIPMLIMKLSWDANISAFLMWVIIGFFISVVDLKLNAVLKGVLISYLVLLPAAILIGWGDPKSLIPIIIMTTILGALLGIIITRRGPR
jgi:hypothetical protein